MTEDLVHLEDDALLDVALGLVDRDEREPLRGHLFECPACEGRLRDVVADRVRNAARLAPALAQAGPVPRSVVVPFRRSRRFAIPVALAAAAMALLVLWPGRVSQTPGPPWLEAPGESVYHRDDPTGVSADLEAALDAYAERNPEEAIRRLESIRVEGTREHLRRIYLANALAQVGRWEDVITELAPVPLDAVPEPWGPEARWTLFVALRETGRKVEADATLRALAQEPGPAGVRAREELGAQ